MTSSNLGIGSLCTDLLIGGKMRTIYKRIMSIVCTILIIIPILVLPINANYYGVTCTQEDHEGYGVSQYYCRTCLLIAKWLPSNSDLPDASVEDSYCIPEDDVIAATIKKDLDKRNEGYPENFDESATIKGLKEEIYFRIFSGPVLNGFYTAGTYDGQINVGTPNHLHRILTMCNKVYYSTQGYYTVLARDKNGKFFLNDDGSLATEEIMLFDETRYYINPVNNRISAGDAYNGGDFSYFLKDPKVALTSAEATKHLADQIEIKHTFGFVDNSAGIVYCVTNEGDYVYFSSSMDNEDYLRLIFPAERFKKMLNELTIRYAEMNDITYQKAWSAVLAGLQAKNNIEFIINYHSKDEIFPYISGGEATVISVGLTDDDYGKALIKDDYNNNQKQTEQENTEAPVDLENNDNGSIFTVLFILETAIVVGGIVTLLTVFASRARKRKKKLKTDE